MEFLTMRLFVAVIASSSQQAACEFDFCSSISISHETAIHNGANSNLGQDLYLSLLFAFTDGTLSTSQSLNGDSNHIQGF